MTEFAGVRKLMRKNKGQVTVSVTPQHNWFGTKQLHVSFEKIN